MFSKCELYYDDYYFKSTIFYYDIKLKQNNAIETIFGKFKSQSVIKKSFSRTFTKLSDDNLVEGGTDRAINIHLL